MKMSSGQAPLPLHSRFWPVVALGHEEGGAGVAVVLTPPGQVVVYSLPWHKEDLQEGRGQGKEHGCGPKGRRYGENQGTWTNMQCAMAQMHMQCSHGSDMNAGQGR